MLKNLWHLRGIGATLLHTNALRKNATKTFAQAVAADESTATAAGALDDSKKPNPFARAANEVPEVADLHLTVEEREKRLKVLQLELDIAYQEGRKVPTLEFLQEEQWQRILALNTKSARMKYYAFLWQIEMKKQSHQQKREERLEKGLQRRAEVLAEREQNQHIIYGLAHTSMFLRIYDTAINQWQNNRLVQAMQFSPKIVLDCSYDEAMNRREAENAAKQLMLCFAENRAHDDPFDMHYCNVDLQSMCMRKLQRYIPTMLNVEFPMNVHQQCFTELFPKQNLVYLTPHCRTDLKEYNADDIYIIGAMVDTVNNEPLSLAKAKRLGLRMARLPLDQYLQWGAGSGKSLTLNQVLNIMLDLKRYKDWQKALVHVPRRKVVDLREQVRRDAAFNRRADKFKMERIEKLLNFEQQTANNVRSQKDRHQFKLETWASKNKFKD